jgi:hypothetical protein
MPLSTRTKAKLFSATPEQRAKIAQATAHANRLQKEVIENACAFVISGLLIYGTWELSSRVVFINNLVSDWIRPLAYEKAVLLLQSVKSDNIRLFARNDIFGMYERFHPALIDLNIEMNAIPDDVYVDMEPHRQNLFAIMGTKNEIILNFFMAICDRSINKARFEADLYILGGIIVTVPFLQKLIIDLFLTKIFSRTFHYFTRKSPQKWLNRVSADDLISELMRANSKNKSFEKIIFHGMHIFTLLNMVYIIADILSGSVQTPPIFVIFIASCLITALKNMYLDYYRWRAEIRLQETLDEVSNSFDTTLSDFGELYLMEKGDSLSECYLNFTAHNDRELSTRVVNRIVKDMLVKNNIPIFEYDNATITLEALRLAKEVSTRIKQQIQLHLQYHKNIRKLRRQLEYFFGMHSSAMEIFLKDEDVPYAFFEIDRSPTLYKLDVLQKLFPGNRITITATGIEIEGNQPAETIVEYNSGLKENDLLTSESIAGPAKRSSSAKISKSLALLQAPAPSEPMLPAPVPRQHWHTETEDYDTQEDNVFPMQTKEQTYVTFALPMRLFPTEKCYQQFRTKVEEGRKASNDKGRQGLQVRQERVRDDTLPHRPFFLSHMRCKLLGKWGDMRVHAEKLVNENNAALYRFCSFDPANH